MTGSTHLAAGIAGAVLLADGTIGGAAAVLLGSLLPDIDSTESLLGRRIPLLPRLLPHRTVTHSALFCCACYFIHAYLPLGLLLHILLDAMNPMGVQLLWPARKWVRMPVISSLSPQGGLVDRLLGLLLGLLDTALLLVLVCGDGVFQTCWLT